MLSRHKENFIKEKTTLLESIENELNLVLGRYSTVEILDEALRYSLFPAGKRIRPLLSLCLYRDLGKEDISNLVGPACAIELLHAASLVHDDLPALDNDELRRGRPTLHKAYGEANAILVGDYLMPFAFELISDCGLSDSSKVKLCVSLSKAFMDVCHGQVRDMLEDESRGTPKLIHSLKTGALFRAAAEFAAIGAEVDQKNFDACSQLGAEMGVCFQIVDDYLDCYGTDEIRGKAAGSDQKNKKITCFTGVSKEEGLVSLTNSVNLVENILSEVEAGLSGGVLNRVRMIFSSIVERTTYQSR